MSDFQSFLDDTLSSIKISDTIEDKVYENYDIYAEISAQISSIRSSAKMTQKELAKECGLTQANISNIEKGISKPTIDSLKKIADAFGKRLRIEFEDREEIS
jgi:DNA-binding XRE family transcriptional regulator